jgi:hypothetical protein
MMTPLRPRINLMASLIEFPMSQDPQLQEHIQDLKHLDPSRRKLVYHNPQCMPLQSESIPMSLV